MAESSTHEQIPSQQEQVPQKDQSNEPESSIPFERVTQVLFYIGDIIFNDNNEVALLCPPHTNSDYFKVFLDFIPAVVLGRHSQKHPTNTKSICLNFCTLPKLLRTLKDYARLIWEDIINKLNKKAKEKVVPYPRFLSMFLEHKMEGYGNDNVTLNPTQMSLKAPDSSSKAEKKVTQCINPKAKFELKKKQILILYNHPQSKIEAAKAEVDHGINAPNDFISQQQGMDKETKNISFDHISAGTDPRVLVKKAKSASEGLETVLTKPATRKGASYIEKEIKYAEEEFNTSPDLSTSDDTKKEITLEDLSKLVPNLDMDFMDLDSPKY
nr:hypothetical protein [Tanacetum cinerariifolium]